VLSILLFKLAKNFERFRRTNLVVIDVYTLDQVAVVRLQFLNVLKSRFFLSFFLLELCFLLFNNANIYCRFIPAAGIRLVVCLIRV